MAPDHRSEPGTVALRAAVRHTLAYADIFDYPLTTGEIHRYLHGVAATPDDLHALLAHGVAGVEDHGGFYVLAGRLWTIAERRRRAAISGPLAGRAHLYARLLKYVPFVRMVGLTGSLAMGNVDGRGDIDLLVVAAPGRVWLGRAAVIALVYLARLAGDTLCPNYVLAEDALTLDDASVYGAHELAQMVPLYGRAVYRRLWAANPRVAEQLPNAGPYPPPPDRLWPAGRALKRGVERLLGGALGDGLEAWERRRKTARLSRQRAAPSAEIVFSPDRCKGHFERHRARVLAAYQRRLAQVHEGALLAAGSRAPEHAEGVGA